MAPPSTQGGVPLDVRIMVGTFFHAVSLATTAAATEDDPNVLLELYALENVKLLRVASEPDYGLPAILAQSRLKAQLPFFAVPRTLPTSPNDISGEYYVDLDCGTDGLGIIARASVQGIAFGVHCATDNPEIDDVSIASFVLRRESEGTALVQGIPAMGGLDEDDCVFRRFQRLIPASDSGWPVVEWTVVGNPTGAGSTAFTLLTPVMFLPDSLSAGEGFSTSAPARELRLHARTRYQ